jgi:TonB family protein
VWLAEEAPTLLSVEAPPFPADSPGLPEGAAVLFVTVDANGAVQQAQVVRGLHPELDQLARKAALEAIYEPAYDPEGSELPVHSVPLKVVFDNPLVENRSPPEGQAADRLTKAPELLGFVQASYPSWAEEHGLEATVEMRLTVDVWGEVVDVQVLGPAGFGFDEAAVEAVWQFRFTPAEAGPVPVPVSIDYAYAFVMEVVEGEDGETETTPGAVLRGRILERGTRDFVEGAEVLLEPSGLSAITDRWGRFRVDDVPEGEADVLVTAASFEPYRTQEIFAEGQELVATYYLRPEAGGVNEVVVRTRRERKDVVRRTIEIEEIKRVPGTFGDPLRVVQNLPGVARAPLDLGILIIRGSGPEDSSVYIDGVFVPAIYHFGAFRSVINAEMFDSFDFYPGGFGPRFGRAIGGTIDVNTLREFPDQLHGVVDLNAFDSSVFLKGPWPRVQRDDEGNKELVASDGGGGWAASFRRSYLDAVTPLAVGSLIDLSRTVLPRWWDYQVKAGIPLSSQHELSAFVYGSGDKLLQVFDTTVNRDDPNFTRAGLSTTFHRGNLQWRWTPGPRFQLDTVASLGWDSQEFDLGAFFSGNIRGSLALLRADLTAELSPWIVQRGGLDLAVTRFDAGFGTESLSLSENPLDERTSFLFESRSLALGPALWSDLEITLLDERLKLFPGLRLDYYYLDDGKIRAFDFFTLDPRFHFRAQVAKRTTVTGSAGIYRQYPIAFEVFDDSGISSVLPESSPQVTLGFEQYFTDFLRLDVQVYGKWPRDLIVYGADNDIGDTDTGFFSSTGKGRIYGMEVFVRYLRHKGFFGWISYTFQRSFLRDRPEQDWYPFDFDEPHILNAVASYELPKGFIIGGRVRYVTGRPYTPLRPPIIFDADTASYFVSGGDQNSARLPPFFAVDLRLDKNFRFKRWMLGLYVELTNLTNHRNAESVTYSHDYSQRDYIYGLPFLPNLGVRAEF